MSILFPNIPQFIIINYLIKPGQSEECLWCPVQQLAMARYAEGVPERSICDGAFVGSYQTGFDKDSEKWARLRG